MMRHRIVDHRTLKAEMKAVAGGRTRAPSGAARASFNSVQALTRLLTTENRRLLATIRDREPKSIADLAKMTGRAAPNLTRTLNKLEGAGLIRMETINRRKVPRTTITKLSVEIDPFAVNDRVEVV
jgi:predicted transcriptional regulator